MSDAPKKAEIEMEAPARIPVVPTQNPTSTARALLEATFARDTVTLEAKAADEAQWVWAYACDRNKMHLGIFFTADPRGRSVFGPGDWYAVYHDNAKPFDFELADVVCQECFARTGERVPLRVSTAPSSGRGAGANFLISQSWMERFAHRIERKKLEEWKPVKHPAMR